MYLVTLILVICSCKASKSTMSVNSGESNSYKVASIKRTSCYGACPEYELTFYSNLTVSYEGIKNVEMIGSYTSKVTQLQMDQIQKRYTEIQFLELDDSYTSAVSDLPTTYVYFSDGKQKKTVMDYTGAPKQLKDLENFLDGFVSQLEWKEAD